MTWNTRSNSTIMVVFLAAIIGMAIGIGTDYKWFSDIGLWLCGLGWGLDIIK